MMSRMVSGTVRSMFSHVVTTSSGGLAPTHHVDTRSLLESPTAAKVDNIPAGEIVMSTETVALKSDLSPLASRQ